MKSKKPFDFVFVNRNCDSFQNLNPSVQTMRKPIDAIVKSVWELLSTKIIIRLETNKSQIHTIIQLKVKQHSLCSHYRQHLVNNINSTISNSISNNIPKSTCIWKCPKWVHQNSTSNVYIRHPNSFPVNVIIV